MTTAADLRRRELGLIHQAKAALGLDDETYRTMLATVTAKPGKPGKRSAADLDWRERKAVLDHLKTVAAGADGGRPKLPRSPRAATVAPEKAPLVRKIRAQLINHPTGRKPDSYADGMSKQMFGVDKYTWCTPEQLEKLIQALAVDSRRRG